MVLAEVGVLAEIYHVAVAAVRGRQYDQPLTGVPRFDVFFNVFLFDDYVIIDAALFQQFSRDALGAVLGHDEELTVHTQKGNSPSDHISSGGFCSMKR